LLSLSLLLSLLFFSALSPEQGRRKEAELWRWRWKREGAHIWQWTGGVDGTVAGI
jgi:hypothetical protein